MQDVGWGTKYMEELLALLGHIPAELESHDKQCNYIRIKQLVLGWLLT